MLSVDNDAIRPNVGILDQLRILLPPRSYTMAISTSVSGNICALRFIPDTIFTRYTPMADVT